MDVFINTDKSPALMQAKATGSSLSGFRVKRGAVVPLSVTVLGSQFATGLRMGIKAKGNYEGDLLILAEADSGSQTEQGTRFDLKLIASSLALNDALDVGEGTDTAPATLAVMAEFAWQKDGETRLSDTLQTTIINDIIRLATDAPETAAGEYPAPDLVATKSWVNSKQATPDTAGFVMLGTDETLSGKTMTTTACYLGIWQLDDAGEPKLLGVSTNAAVQTIGQATYWAFEAIPLSGRTHCFCLLPTQESEWLAGNLCLAVLVSRPAKTAAAWYLLPPCPVSLKSTSPTRWTCPGLPMSPTFPIPNHT